MGGAMTSLPLLDAPTRGRAKPPRHLADLTMTERRQALTDLGERGFRAAQLSRHYFTNLTSDPASMTDLPTGDRERLATSLLPPLLTPIRVVACDGGATRKTLWRAFDRTPVEGVLMRSPGRPTGRG